VLHGYVPHECQTNSQTARHVHALPRCALEQIENVRQPLPRDSRTIVLDAEHDETANRLERNLDTPEWLRVLAGIVQQVRDGLSYA
jgi:hypothetical protein